MLYMSSLIGLFPGARRVLLAVLLRDPSRPWYVRELVRESGLMPRAVSVELARLSGAGLLQRRTVGRRVYFQADASSPLLAPLRELFVAAGSVTGGPVRHAEAPAVTAAPAVVASGPVGPPPPDVFAAQRPLLMEWD